MTGVLHGFDGVEREVHEYLLQLRTVRHDFGRLARRGHSSRRPRANSVLNSSFVRHADHDYLLRLPASPEGMSFAG